MAQLRGITDDLLTLINQGPAVAQNLAAIIRRVNPYIGTVRRVVDDPAFPTLMQRVQTITNMTPSSGGGGGGGGSIGLAKAVPLLDGYIYALRNPWAPWLAGLGILALIGGVGYRMGQRKAGR